MLTGVLLWETKGRKYTQLEVNRQKQKIATPFQNRVCKGEKHPAAVRWVPSQHLLHRDLCQFYAITSVQAPDTAVTICPAEVLVTARPERLCSPPRLPGLAYPESHGQDKEEVESQHGDVTCLQASLGKCVQGVGERGRRAAGAAVHGAERLGPVEGESVSDARPPFSQSPRHLLGTAEQDDAREGCVKETDLRVESSTQPFTPLFNKYLQGSYAKPTAAFYQFTHSSGKI